MFGVKSGALREVREFVWSRGFAQPQHTVSEHQKKKPGLGVVDGLYAYELRSGASKCWVCCFTMRLRQNCEEVE